MAVSRACYNEKQYILYGTTGAVIPQMGVVLLKVMSACKPPISFLRPCS